MTDWTGFEGIELHDSVDDFVASVRGEPTNAELNRWGLYRQAVARHYQTTPVAYVRLPRHRMLRPPFRWIASAARWLWSWRRGIGVFLLFLAILFVGGVR